MKLQRVKKEGGETFGWERRASKTKVGITARGYRKKAEIPRLLVKET